MVKIRNEVIRDEVGVMLVEDKLWEARRRFGCVKENQTEVLIMGCERIKIFYLENLL